MEHWLGCVGKVANPFPQVAQAGVRAADVPVGVSLLTQGHLPSSVLGQELSKCRGNLTKCSPWTPEVLSEAPQKHSVVSSATL